MLDRFTPVTRPNDPNPCANWREPRDWRVASPMSLPEQALEQLRQAAERLVEGGDVWWLPEGGGEPPGRQGQVLFGRGLGVWKRAVERGRTHSRKEAGIEASINRVTRAEEGRAAIVDPRGCVISRTVIASSRPVMREEEPWPETQP